MDVFLLRVGDPAAPSAITTFRELAAASSDPHHRVVDDVDAAEVVLFVDAHLLGRTWLLREVSKEAAKLGCSERLFVYDERDRPWCRFPGLYPSMPARFFDGRFQRASSYLPVNLNNLDGDERSSEDRSLLFSFVGSDTHHCRRPLFALEHPRGFVSRSDGFVFYDSGSRDFVERKRLFRDATARSSFVLCPRGVGTSSIRLFETMASGRAPVVISDDWVPPRGPDWAAFSIRWPESRPGDLASMLEAREHEAIEMGRRARGEFERWFSREAAFNTMVDQLAELRATRVAFPSRGLRGRRMVEVGVGIGASRARVQAGAARRRLLDRGS